MKKSLLLFLLMNVFNTSLVVPMSPTVVDSAGQQDQQSCSICLEDVIEGTDGICKTTCNHLFHEECLYPWLDQHNTCPNCRTVITTGATRPVEQQPEIEQVAYPDIFNDIRSGDVRAVQEYLEAGFDINTCDSRHNASLLHWAMWLPVPAIAVLLIERGAQVNVCDRYGMTPLNIAAIRNCFYLAFILVRYGALANIANANAMMPLHFAVVNNNIEMTSLLCAYGAIVNVFNSKGETPLHLATLNKNYRIVSLLLRSHALANVCDSWRRSPLSIAAAYGDMHLCSLLISHGAVVTPYIIYCARSRNYEDLAQWLESCMINAAHSCSVAVMPLRIN
jgi:ankyrin repeat protein